MAEMYSGLWKMALIELWKIRSTTEGSSLWNKYILILSFFLLKFPITGDNTYGNTWKAFPFFSLNKHI